MPYVLMMEDCVQHANFYSLLDVNRRREEIHLCLITQIL